MDREDNTATEPIAGPSKRAAQRRTGFGPHRRSWRWAVIFLLLGAAMAKAQSGRLDRGYDEIARVNGVVITRNEFQVVYRQAVERHAQQGRPIDETHIAPIRRAVIQRMVEEELLVQESRRLGIDVAAEEVDRDMATARARFANEAAFQEELAQQFVDEAQYRRKLKRQRAIDRLLAQEVDPTVSVSEAEIRRFYDTNPQRYHAPEKIRVRHILIRKGTGDEPETHEAARRSMTTIKEKLDRGEDFAILAQDYSQEPTGAQGGDLGYLQRGQLLPSIEPAVFDLAVGEISPILTTEQGYHLFQVVDRQPASETAYEEARADIEKTLIQRKREDAVRAYIASLRKQADIRAAQ